MGKKNDTDSRTTATMEALAHPDIAKVIDILKSKDITFTTQVCFIGQESNQEKQILYGLLTQGIKTIKGRDITVQEKSPSEIANWSLIKLRSMISLGTLVTFKNGKYVNDHKQVLESVYRFQNFDQKN